MVTWKKEGHGESLANGGTAAGSVLIQAAGKLTDSSQRLVLLASCSSQSKGLEEPAEAAETRSYMMLPDATCGLRSPSSVYFRSAKSLENKLEALQCHFTWGLIPRRPNLICERNILEDIGTEEGNFWLGPIYNLRGFIQYQLGSTEEALNLFNRATETFQRQKNADEGPWLMVNFGNLAWLHHLQGEDEKSRDYLSKVDALMRNFPAPPEEELHPEVCAEKAWTLMQFDKEKLEAAELFQRAIRMQPDTVEWQSSRAILSAETFKDNMKNMEPGVFEALRSAKERDPENLYVAALHLEARAAKGEQIQDEARVLVRKVLERPASIYSGISPLLRLYRNHISKDEAVKLAKKALRRHPDSQYLKRSAAICYMKRILSKNWETKPSRSMTKRAISLWEEMIAAYGEHVARDQTTLANLYAQLNTDKAEQIYQELLEREDLDPAGKQMLYNCYSNFLFFNRNERYRSIEYQMRAAEIQVESMYLQRSIRELQKTLARSKDPELCRRIREILRNQPETQNQ
ncbi:interferon-induced protein with tetratricopeptide repeats 2-like [Anableps anableps]